MTSADEPLREDTRSKIIAAASRLLQDGGARAVTTRAVAAAAGVQAPAIYRLFGDKDGLVDAVAEQVMADYVADKSAAATDPDPVADLRSGWELHIRFGLANPELSTILGSRQSPATAAGIDVLRARVRRLAEAGRLAVDPDRALAMIHAAGSGAVTALLSSPPDERDPGLADAMWDAVAARILTRRPATKDNRPLTVAVAFAARLADLPGLSDAEKVLMAEWLSRSIGVLEQR